VPLKAQLESDLKEAMRQQDVRRREVLRMALAALRNAEIAAGRALEDPEALDVLAKEAKRRQESIEEFRKAGRQDRVEQEEAELAVLTAYLPKQLTREEIEQVARAVIEQTGASGPRDIGKVMPVLMQQLRGRADGREVNAVVRELLASS
jgi:hypothetical protein